MSIWAGEFGNEYTRRNRGHVSARAAVWRNLIPPQTKSVLEVGANRGLNLQAISSLGINELYACEPNDLALNHLLELGLLPKGHVTADFADKLSFPNGVADLAFTTGVLIHISTDRLIPSMREIHRCARRWIVAGEYFAPSEEMIPYRGHNDALWRRDYGSLWLDNFSDLHCLSCTFAWKRTTGLDNLTFWVFEKGNHG